MKANQEFEFKINNVAGKNEDEKVIARITITKDGGGALDKITSLKYCSKYNEDGKTCSDEGYRNLSKEIDSQTIYYTITEEGFKLYDFTSSFKATFTEEGSYKIKVELVQWNDNLETTKTSGKVLNTATEETIEIKSAE